MELTLLEQLTLLALDDEKGTFLTDSISFQPALASALLMELFLSGKIELNQSAVTVVAGETVENAVTSNYFKMIKDSKKTRNIKHWVEAFSMKANTISKKVITELIDKGILNKREDRFLWVISVKKYPTQNAQPENALRAHLLSVVQKKEQATLKDILLFSIIDAAEMGRTVFGKNYNRELKSGVNWLLAKHPLAEEMHSSVKEMRDVIIAILVTVITTTTTTTIINS